jgi:hypothetical protein
MSGSVGAKLYNYDNIVFYLDPTSSYNELFNILTPSITGTTKLNNSISFNGTSDWINYPFYNDLQVSSVTIDCWFKPSSAGTQAQLFSILNWDNFNFGFYTRGFSLVWNNNAFSFYYGDGFSVPCVVQTSTTASTINNWCNIIVTYSLGVTKFYFNGTLLTTRTGSSANIDWSYGSGAPTTIAISKKNNATGGYLQGHIGPIKVYNKVISESEINTNYNQLKSRYQ